MSEEEKDTLLRLVLDKELSGVKARLKYETR